MATQAATQTISGLAQDVREGLSKPGQKELASKYLYDEIGSSLFESITHLPEYGLSHAGERLLRKYADDIVALVPSPLIVAELGAGSGKKTRWLLEALSRRHCVTYHPIEISRSALTMCRRELDDIDCLSIRGFARDYLDGLLEVAARRPPEHHLMVLFLGSTIGNFDRSQGEEFLMRVHQILAPGDSLLLATDLEKPIPQLLLAYDDPLGLTAAFNLNLLARLNRELEADFRLRQFQHVARYNQDERRIEMHLQSLAEQTVMIPGADFTTKLERGETIWTESSHKYNLLEVTRMAQQCGFRCDTQWVDEEWPFAQSLFIAT